MRRVLVALAACLSMLLVGAVGIAQAGEPEDSTVPPAFSPPTTLPVTDTASAETFLEGYVSERANLRQLLNVRRSRIRVLDVNATCLQHPVTLTRFGCAFTLRALVIQRRHHWRNWSHGGPMVTPSSRRGGHKGHRVRIRTFGCLGIARIDAVDAAAPTVQIPLSDCQRIRNRDLVAVEPV
jgi:hypothetical protein